MKPNKPSAKINSLLIISALTLVLVNSCKNNPENVLINREEFNLPLSDEKLVVAHNMTNIIRYKGHKMEDSCDPEFYPPKGNITEPLGGLVQVNVMADNT